MKVVCPHCQQKYNIDESMLGEEIVCQVCDGVMVFNTLEKDPQNPVERLSPKPSGSAPLATQPTLASAKSKQGLISGLLIVTLIGLGYIAHTHLNDRDDTVDQDSSLTIIETAAEEEAPITPQPLDKKSKKKKRRKPARLAETKATASQKKRDDGAILKSESISDIENSVNEKGNLLISHFEDVVKPFAQEHCIYCHGPKKKKGGFRIDLLMNTGLIRSEADAEHWQEVLDLINTGEMPPPEEDQPAKEEMTAMLDSLYQTTANARDIIASKGAGVMRRLNSREYTNVIKDLLGLTIPEDSLPQDRGAFGFDTLGNELNTTPAELQAYIDVGHSLMTKLTADYSLGREVPKETHSIFGGISRTPKDNEAENLFRRFVLKMYHHQPVPGTMIKDMNSLFKYNRRKGSSFWDAASVSLACALASPNLIYIIEKDVELDQLDIANRLSLMLWSSVPDETLIQLAKQGELTKPEIYAQQFERMIQDDKAHRFFDTFISQWLELDRLELVNFDEGLFPKLKKQEDSLKKSMEQETLSFMRYLIQENKPARDIVNANFTIINAQLAKHYDIRKFRGKKDQFSKVTLKGKDKVRGGLLGQGSVQMLTSNGARTSPVERGVYILRKLLDSSPPPAPADVPEVEDITGEHQTTRDLLKHHMTTAQCATCHVKIDPLGFGMESFGPLGRWRTHEGKLPIDASGQMTNGKKFDNYQGLIASLAVNDERIAKGFVKAVMSYAIGRKIRYTDSGEITKIVQSSKETDFKLRDLIFKIAQSKTFQTKR